MEIFKNFAANYGNEASVIGLIIVLMTIFFRIIKQIQKYNYKKNIKYQEILSLLDKKVDKTMDTARTQAKRQEAYTYINFMLDNHRETLLHTKIEFWGMLILLLLSSLIYLGLFAVEGGINWFISLVLSIIATIVFTVMLLKFMKNIEREKNIIYGARLV